MSKETEAIIEQFEKHMQLAQMSYNERKIHEYAQNQIVKHGCLKGVWETLPMDVKMHLIHQSDEILSLQQWEEEVREWLATAP